MSPATPGTPSAGDMGEKSKSGDETETLNTNSAEPVHVDSVIPENEKFKKD